MFIYGEQQPLPVISDNHEQFITIPDPMLRAPRQRAAATMPSTTLYSGKQIGSDAIVAIVSRHTRGAMLNQAQRLSHFPASSFICLSWHNDLVIGTIKRQKKLVSWQQLHEKVLISGSQSKPTVYWSPHDGRGGMIYFTISAAKALFDIDVTAIQDQTVCARQHLGPTWFAMFDQLLASKDDVSMLKIINHYISARWTNIHHAAHPIQSLQYAGHRWVNSLVSQAKLWQSSRSLRQIQRSVKMMSGRSLREWQLLVSTEQVFFEAAQDDQTILHRLDWAALALEAGFADQAHLSRTVKRITGFPPAEFARRFVEDESFWIYRLWI